MKYKRRNEQESSGDWIDRMIRWVFYRFVQVFSRSVGWEERVSCFGYLYEFSDYVSGDELDGFWFMV